MDKNTIIHFGLGVGISALIYAFYPFEKGKLTLSIVGPGTAGIIKESLDSRTHKPDPIDYLATQAGAAVSLKLYFNENPDKKPWKKKFKKKLKN